MAISKLSSILGSLQLPNPELLQTLEVSIAVVVVVVVVVVVSDGSEMNLWECKDWVRLQGRFIFVMIFGMLEHWQRQAKHLC